PDSPTFSRWGSSLAPTTGSPAPAACSARPREAESVGLSPLAATSTADAFSFVLAWTPSDTTGGGAIRVSSGGSALRAAASALAAMRINVPLNSVRVFIWTPGACERGRLRTTTCGQGQDGA